MHSVQNKIDSKLHTGCEFKNRFLLEGTFVFLLQEIHCFGKINVFLDILIYFNWMLGKMPCLISRYHFWGLQVPLGMILTRILVEKTNRFFGSIKYLKKLHGTVHRSQLLSPLSYGCDTQVSHTIFFWGKIAFLFHRSFTGEVCTYL